MGIDTKDIASGTGLEALGKVKAPDKMTFPDRPQPIKLGEDFNPDSVAGKLEPALEHPAQGIQALAESGMGNYFTSDLSKMDGAGERRPYPEGSSARVPGPINTETPSPIFTLPDRPDRIETPVIESAPITAGAKNGGDGPKEDTLDTGAYYSSDLKGMDGAGERRPYPEGSSARVPGPINEAPVATVIEPPTVEVDDKKGEKKGMLGKLKDKITRKKEDRSTLVETPAETPADESASADEANPVETEAPTPDAEPDVEDAAAEVITPDEKVEDPVVEPTPVVETAAPDVDTPPAETEAPAPDAEPGTEDVAAAEDDTAPDAEPEIDSEDDAPGGAGSGEGPGGEGEGSGDAEKEPEEPVDPEANEEPDAEPEAEETPEAAAKAKEIRDLEDKIDNDTATEEDMKRLRELKQDPETLKNDLKEKIKNGTATDEDIAKYNELKSPEGALSDKEKLEKMKKEMEDLGTEMMMKIARGEIPTEEERARMEELYGEVRIQELGFTEAKARALWKESQKSRYGSERGARRIKDLQEKAQEMLMLEYQMMTIGERFKLLKEKRDEAMTEYKAKIDATNSAGLEERPKAKSEEVSALFTLLGIKGELAGMKYFAIEADARIRDLDQELKYKAGATDGWDALKDWAGAKVQSLVTEIVILADETLPDMGRSDSIQWLIKLWVILLVQLNSIGDIIISHGKL